MPTDAEIALISSAASTAAVIIAVFIAIFTIREMAEQRRTAYRPQLVVSPTSVILRRREDGLLEWEQARPHSLILPLHNIGLGAAQEVSVVWTFSREEFDEFFREMDPDRYVNILRDPMHVRIKVGENSDTWIMTRHPGPYFTHVLPAGTGAQHTELEVSPEYTAYLGAFLEVLRNPHAKLPVFWPFLPSIVAEISYRDIGGNPHRQQLRLKFEYGSLIRDPVSGQLCGIPWYTKLAPDERPVPRPKWNVRFRSLLRRAGAVTHRGDPSDRRRRELNALAEHSEALATLKRNAWKPHGPEENEVLDEKDAT